MTKQNNGGKRQAGGIGGLAHGPTSAGQRPYRRSCLFDDSCRGRKDKKKQTACNDFLNLDECACGYWVRIAQGRGHTALILIFEYLACFFFVCLFVEFVLV